jgi:hypothetical protein
MRLHHGPNQPLLLLYNRRIDKWVQLDLAIDPNWLAHLGSRFERGRPVLFTGAGFSTSASSVRGRPVASYDDLKKLLWEICFPDAAYEPGAALQDLYEAALQSSPKRLTDVLRENLSVDVSSIPDWYQEVFSLPWQRAYTLNVDNLALAAAQKFSLPRAVVQISGMAPLGRGGVGDAAKCLEFIHLNGTIEDLPAHVTFSVTQYADRLAAPDPAYMQFVGDFLSSPVVFIGTRLDEPPLWQHIVLRQGRGGREMSELRQRSYLVTPDLDRARRALLSKFNVAWIPMTAEQFTIEALKALGGQKAKGLDFLAARSAAGREPEASVSEVSDLSREVTEDSGFLLGNEPSWSDIRSGRAVMREADEKLSEAAEKLMRRGGDEPRGLVLVTGTAGSGKSTSLMRVALELVAEGHRVAWVDRSSEASPRDISQTMRGEDPPAVLAIDDADLLGSSLTPLIREVATDERHPLVIAAVRSGKVDRVLAPPLGGDLPFWETSMPPLEDSDIGKLIDVLGREKRLGRLTGMSRSSQEAAFRDQAGRQLLVAMIQATSGLKFEEKAFHELNDLDGSSQLVYAVIAVASAYRFGLSRDEILIATGETTNERLNSINALVARRIVTQREDGSVWARHRVIAEIIRDELLRSGQLTKPVAGLALLAASKVRQAMRRQARPWRLLRTIINHDHLYRIGGLDFARSVYGDLEGVIHWDYHFWLQRGSLEVEEGDLRQAELYLVTARGIAPGDPFVETEWAYLLFKKALAVPSVDAEKMVSEATALLHDLISRRNDHYPYHVLGSQGLAWARRHIRNADEKTRYLKDLQEVMRKGCGRFPIEKALHELYDAIKREYLGLAVPG